MHKLKCFYKLNCPYIWAFTVAIQSAYSLFIMALVFLILMKSICTEQYFQLWVMWVTGWDFTMSQSHSVQYTLY